MRISQRGLDFIKGFERFVPYPYDDKVAPVRGKYVEWKGGPVKGTLTIGYGHTDKAKHPLKIKAGLRITEKEACQILDVDLDECEDAVNRLVKVPLTQGQFDALTSLVFNIGTGAFSKSSILRKLNVGEYEGARAAFDLYVKSGGEYMRGLQRRRDGEQALWGDATPEVPPAPEAHHVAEVDKESWTKEDAAVTGGGIAGTLQTAAAISSAAKETKENVGSFDPFTMIDKLIVRPSFWLAVALLLAVAYWRRWPAWFWRRVLKEKK